MSIDKFRFVSPGVFIDEIDNTLIQKPPEAIGPVVIGRSVRGPLMRPVKVPDYSRFVEIFGEPINGSSQGDTWREGNKSSPTYGAYAAQAYLRNSGPLTFVRLGGYQNESRSSESGEAGWSMSKAYGVLTLPISSSSENIYTTPANGVTASLAAIIYYSGSSGVFGVTGTPLSGASETVSQATGTWIRAGSDLEFKLVVDGETKVVDFSMDSKKYIRTIINTNPILTNPSLFKDTYKTYFLGPTFKTFVDSNSSTAANQYAVCLVELGGNDISFTKFKTGAKNAESGWVVSQHKGQPGDFKLIEGKAPVQNLFKVYSLSEGEWNSQNIKISIEDIKEPPNKFTKYGSFTLSVRSMQDNDLNPVYFERFVNLNLDPTSENFIAKRIGDKYSTWSYSKKAFIEYGTYDNMSKFIRIQVDARIESGLAETDLLPYGFYAPAQFNVTSKVSGTIASTSNVSWIKTQLSGNQVITASYALPTLPMLASTLDSTSNTFNSVYFGFKTNYLNTKRYNPDVVDVTKVNPDGYTPTTSSFLFSLDDLSGSYLSGTFDQSKKVTWAVGNREKSESITAYGSSSVILNYFNRFTFPLVGGSDGVDITEKDPFCVRRLISGDEYSNYAFNSVKVAIESVSDPDVVEMNLATMPGITNSSLTTLLIDRCELRGDSLAIIDLEDDLDPSDVTKRPSVSTVVSTFQKRNLNSSYGCAYFPWVLIKDATNNNTVWVPPSVVALGTFSSSQRNTELWFAPAGFNRGGLSNGSAGLPVIQAAVRINSKERDDLYDACINPIATFPSEGIVIFGQKTLQVAPSALDRINVRRLMIYVKKEISRMATTLLFDPNVEVTWKRFTDQVNPFLASITSRFGLSEFRVVLDQTTTTDDLVDRNIVYAKIFLKPTRAIEYIALDFALTNTGASFAD